MKKTLTLFLLAAFTAALFVSVAACTGSYVNPSVSGGGGGSGGSSSVKKPEPLLTGTTYSQAMDKLDEIIAYCKKKPSTRNDAVKVGAISTQDTLPSSSYWNSSMYVASINTLIAQLE